MNAADIEKAIDEAWELASDSPALNPGQASRADSI